MIPQMMLMPLWPAYGEAFARGDLAWMRQTLKRTKFLGLGISLLMGAPLVLAGPQLIHLWTRGKVELSYTLLIALCASAVAFSSTCPQGVFLFGVNAIRFSAITMTLVAVTSIVLKTVLVRTWALPGVAWGTALPYVLLNGLPAVLYASHLLAKNERLAATAI
jgi:O-antigen/teichoic acid export membrane protein